VIASTVLLTAEAQISDTLPTHELPEQ
jgi:hypothetical protein